MKLQGTMAINSLGHLEIGGCDSVQLAEDFGTPLYILDEEYLRQICRDYYSSFTKNYAAGVIYASKAFLTLAMCKIIEQEGLGLDVVSGGELFTAQRANFPMERVYFHGNNKSTEELKMALDLHIGRIVIDNLEELETLDDLAKNSKKKPKVLLRISPGIEAHTHEYIQTGQIDSKFGLPIATGQAMKAVKLVLHKNNIIFQGLHCHIGSQIFEKTAFQCAAQKMISFMSDIHQETGFNIQELNLGGGLGIYYTADDHPISINAYADALLQAVQEEISKYNLPLPTITIEPGRSIIGPAGTTLYTIGFIKNIPNIRKYVSIDGGMTDNIRPALYQAQYEAILANRALDANSEIVSIAGKCCETGDMLIKDISLPEAKQGDLLAVSSTGAYTYSMSSNYNRLPKPAVVLVKEGKADLIVQRENYNDLIKNDLLPERLK